MNHRLPRRLLPGLGLALVLVMGTSVGVRAEESAPPPVAKETAKAAPEAWEKARDAAIARGVAFLLSHQNENGSFGSYAPTLHDIFAPGPGSHRSFQVASRTASSLRTMK